MALPEYYKILGGDWVRSFQVQMSSILMYKNFK